jgi:hypothetical protein
VEKSNPDPHPEGIWFIAVGLRGRENIYVPPNEYKDGLVQKPNPVTEKVT